METKTPWDEFEDPECIVGDCWQEDANGREPLSQCVRAKNRSKLCL